MLGCKTLSSKRSVGFPSNRDLFLRPPCCDCSPLGVVVVNGARLLMGCRGLCRRSPLFRSLALSLSLSLSHLDLPLPLLLISIYICTSISMFVPISIPMSASVPLSLSLSLSVSLYISTASISIFISILISVFVSAFSSPTSLCIHHVPSIHRPVPPIFDIVAMYFLTDPYVSIYQPIYLSIFLLFFFLPFLRVCLLSIRR